MALRVLSVIVLVIIFFVPFPNVSHNTEGAKQYCYYRLAVYKFYYIEAEGEGYGESETVLYNIDLTEKVGGPLEYFGLKRVKN